MAKLRAPNTRRLLREPAWGASVFLVAADERLRETHPDILQEHGKFRALKLSLPVEPMTVRAALVSLLLCFAPALCGETVLWFGRSGSFYSTGDYDNFATEVAASYRVNRFLYVGASHFYFKEEKTGLKNYPTDVDVRTWETFVGAPLFRFGTAVKQEVRLSLGYSLHHKIAEEFVLHMAARDSAIIRKSIQTFMDTPEMPGSLPNRAMTLYVYPKDENGFYNIIMTAKRNYWLHGIYAGFAYDIRMGRTILSFDPNVRYYPSEYHGSSIPLFIWSAGMKLGFAL